MLVFVSTFSLRSGQVALSPSNKTLFLPFAIIGKEGGCWCWQHIATIQFQTAPSKSRRKKLNLTGFALQWGPLPIACAWLMMVVEINRATTNGARCEKNSNQQIDGKFSISLVPTCPLLVSFPIPCDDGKLSYLARLDVGVNMLGNDCGKLLIWGWLLYLSQQRVLIPFNSSKSNVMFNIQGLSKYSRNQT